MLGAHVSIANGLVAAAQEIEKYGGDAIQIFSTSPRRRALKIRRPAELTAMKKYLTSRKIVAVVHASYLINLSREWDRFSWWLQTLEHDLRFAEAIGARGVVVHCGMRKELSREKAMNNMITCLTHVLSQTDGMKSKIFIESAAGQGTQIGVELEEFAQIVLKMKKLPSKISDRIAVCLDSCHLHAAGHDLSTPEAARRTVAQIEQLIGHQTVELIHFNNSHNKLGSRVDHHQRIESGEIGLAGLLEFYRHFAGRIPIILETPGHGYETEIKMLRKLRRK